MVNRVHEHRMKTAIITTGDEILAGELMDSNSAWLSGELFRRGVAVDRHISVGDALGDLTAVFRAAAEEFDLVFVTGGLGPTDDDRTAEACARLTGALLEIHKPSLERARTRFSARGFHFTGNNLRQFRVPAGAVVYDNPAGLAPGFSFEACRCRFYIFPGVPKEMRAIVEKVLADVAEVFPGDPTGAYRVFKTVGVPESRLAERVTPLLAGFEGVRVGYRTRYPENWIRVYVNTGNSGRSAAILETVAERLRAELKTSLFGTDGDEFPEVVGKLVQDAGRSLSTAESCTGGMIGSLLTDAPGSSRYYAGGVVAYANRVKKEILRVPETILTVHGAVSPECVRAMAAGARKRFKTDLAVAVSGVAGPGGGTEEKPVGLVYLALAAADGTEHRERRFRAERNAVRLGAAYEALDMVRCYLLARKEDR